MINWDDYPNFTEAEFTCSHSGKCDMEPAFMAKLQKLRDHYGKGMTVTSGYRDITHPIEAAKDKPGIHTMGLAVDIACNGQDAYHLLGLALNMGFTGIGVAQSGRNRFLHLDIYTKPPRSNVWSY
jgi:zinc D-Ala-D-Ala carboxypeptidase